MSIKGYNELEIAFLVDHDVFELDVAVHDVFGVKVDQNIEEVFDNGDDKSFFEFVFLLEDFGQIVALDALSNNDDFVVVLKQFVELVNERMVQLR